MKLKKFFAGVLAAAMMLTVGATAAFATEGKKVDASYEGTAGEYNAKMFVPVDGKAEIDLTKVLTVVSGTAPQKMTFNFTVRGRDADAAKGAKAGTLGKDFTTQPSVTLEKTGNEQFTTSTTAYSQTFSIDLVKLLGDNYNKVGKYAYTISENETKIPGITKDSHEYEMIVTVVNKEKDNLTSDTGYGYFVGMYDADGNKVPAEFTNTYNSYSLEVEKTVKGNFGDLNDIFTFYITLGKEAGKDDNYATATVKVSDTSNPANNASWTIGGGQQTITLKHDQTATISNLPVGVTYTVTEKKTNDDGSAWVYTTTGEATAEANKTIAAGDNKVEIVNEHQGTPDMGVILDNAPYIALLAIVAIGGVALMLNKRRRDEE